ncbi:(2Fe-2S)-binding protein [Streptomyces avicenniae]|uniref:(2Fe-2S)-binding protein n=1 Tax=Streptomyces avicenniae TaxID=500153 RepID=UPI00069AC54B|nr:(2Fe-2S)-binding protein [Streptomyces avicenniae]
MYVCSCFGITEADVREHAAAGACTPRQIATRSGAGTDCGSCVRRIQGLLGRGGCPRRETVEAAAAPASVPVALAAAAGVAPLGAAVEVPA